jgi:hypothetical protein
MYQESLLYSSIISSHAAYIYFLHINSLRQLKHASRACISIVDSIFQFKHYIMHARALIYMVTGINSLIRNMVLRSFEKITSA